MNRIHPKPGREFILALGMVLGLGVSPVAALPSTPAAGIGGSSGVSPVNRAIFAGDLDAANRLTGLGERYIEQHALADAEAAFRGALAIVEAALGPTDPRLADSMTALADVRSERRDFAGAETLYRRALAVVETAYGSEGSWRSWRRGLDRITRSSNRCWPSRRVPDTTSSSAARGRAEVPPAQGRLVSERRLGSLGGGVAVLAGPPHPSSSPRS